MGIKLQTPLTLPLARIVADAKLQPRVGGIDADHVRQLAEVAEHWPPLMVIQRGKQYVLADGFHRFAAAQERGLR